MKTLILGAKGNLGVQLNKVFASSGDEVLAWDREEIDITDKELINKKIDDIKPEIIINAAAYNAVDKCEKEEEFTKAEKVNGEAVGYLADAAIRNNSVLVSFSTDYVFPGNQIEGYREDDETEPINKYGETKQLGEKELITRSGKGLKWYLIRTSRLFGPRGDSQLAKPSFFDVMLDLSDKKDQLDIVDEEVGCFTYTPDLAQAVKNLIDNNEGFGKYHITNLGAGSWYKASQELFNQAGVKVNINPITSAQYPRPARRPKFSILINTKIPKLRPWEEALRDYLNN